jgi:glycine cleavage system H lipoate-binding protein/ABC-type phosphate transport system substrate-binding protein
VASSLQSASVCENALYRINKQNIEAMKSGKKTMITMVAMVFAMTTIYAVQDKSTANEDPAVQLRCSAGLADLANEMVLQYQQENAGAVINVASIPENRSEELFKKGGIALANKACLSAADGDKGIRIVVGRDVIVPVMNMNHPLKELILQKGITPEQFASVYKSKSQVSWGELLGTKDTHEVKAYVPGQKCAKEFLGGFIEAAPGDIHGVEVNSPEEMIGLIEADRYAIGFCTLACLTKMERNGVAAGISLIPLDADGSGNIEHFENIYHSYAELSHGIFVGKYPRALYSRIYAVTDQQETTAAETAFLEWMITGSQNALASAGILEMDYSEKASGLRQLYPVNAIVADVPVKATATRTLLIILAGLVLLAVFSWFLMGRSRRQEAMSVVRKSSPGAFGADSLTYPAGLFFDRSHTWTFMEKTGNVRVGIDDFMQHVTGPVSRVMMKSPGEMIHKGEVLITLIQKGKQLEIKSPVSGVVVEHNSELQKDATLLNSDPYADGWVYTVEPASWMAEMKTYFMGEPYGQWLKGEFIRLKDFFSAGLKLKGSAELVPLMQDGGELRDGVLEDLGPEVWEEFQAAFINHK